MKAQCLLYHLYRAWEERSDWSESDSSIQPLLSSDWSESDSSIQPLTCPSLPVGGASLANDGRSECGVNKCGEASMCA